MDLLQDIKNYCPVNEQEKRDRELMLQYMEKNSNYLSREDRVAHFTASMWTVNRERTRTLMVYHNLYDSWSWIGGHADGEEDLCGVALRELQEETGVKNAKLVSSDIFSLEVLTVNGHWKKDEYVSSHLHFNVTYLAEAEETEKLVIQEEENSAVQWWSFEEALAVSKEPWMVERVYKKLMEKCGGKL